MRRARLEDEVTALYARSEAALARRLLERLPPNHVEASEQLTALLANRLHRVVTYRRHLFEDAFTELGRTAKTRGRILWLAVGDPCFSVAFSVPASKRTLPPDSLLEFTRERQCDEISNIVCECWISLLFPCYFEHCYVERYSAKTESLSYSAAPREVPSVVARARAFLEAQGRERLTFPRALRPMKDLRARGRDWEARLFDLVFSDLPYWMWDLNKPRQPMRSLRIGSNIDPASGKVCPGVVDAALEGFRASWREEFTERGRLKSRTLQLSLPEGGLVEIEQGRDGIVKTARIRREGARPLRELRNQKGVGSER